MTSCFLAGSPPPEPPAQLTGAVINSTSIELTWVAPTNLGPNEITGYTLSYKTSVGQIVVVNKSIGVEQTTYEVFNLQAGMTYTFRLAAVNVFGAGPSANLTITLPGREGDKGKLTETFTCSILNTAYRKIVYCALFSMEYESRLGMRHISNTTVKSLSKGLLGTSSFCP